MKYIAGIFIFYSIRLTAQDLINPYQDFSSKNIL